MFDSWLNIWIDFEFNDDQEYQTYLNETNFLLLPALEERK